MKIKMLIITAIVMMLAGSISSCGERSEAGGEVPYKPCPCENSDEALVTIKGDTRLFIMPLMEEENFHMTDESICYHHDSLTTIRLNSDNPNFPSGLTSLNGSAIFNICNFPDYAKQWHEPDGVAVSYEGIVYPNCPEFGCRNICYSLVLTKLKKNESS